MAKGKSIKGKIVCLTVILAVLSAGGLLVARFYVKSRPVPSNDEYAIEVKYEPQNPSDYVRLNNAVTEEMMSPDYWIKLRTNSGADAGLALLSFSQIAKYNYDNKRMIKSEDIEYSLDEIGDEFSAQTTAQFIKDTYFVPENPETLYLNGSSTDRLYWDRLIGNLNLDALDAGVQIRYGFSVSRGTLKRFPTDDAIYNAGENLYYDVLVQSDLQPFMPVAVLHESADGEWYYVLAYGYGGWTRKESVAFCESREDWLARQNPEAFLVVTGKEIRLSTDPFTENLSDLLVPMGTVLPVASIEETPETLHNRISYGNYVAKLPSRDNEGNLVDEYILIPVSEDVNLGYLPYTEENVARLSFKHLGAMYGWGGSFNAQDCSGYVREVYACFGFNFPRVARTQADYVCEKNLDVAKMTFEEKMEILKDAPIGTLLFFPGHIMMYVGTFDGMPYCISAAGNITTLVNEEIIERQVNTVVLTNMIDTKMPDGRTWIEGITKITIP